jgi:hypothetical protein
MPWQNKKLRARIQIQYLRYKLTILISVAMQSAPAALKVGDA